MCEHMFMTTHILCRTLVFDQQIMEVCSRRMPQTMRLQNAFLQLNNNHEHTVVHCKTYVVRKNVLQNMHRKMHECVYCENSYILR
jgi:hypothetical protein